MSSPKAGPSAPDLYVASYRPGFRVALSVLVGVATMIVVGAALFDTSATSDSEPTFTMAVILFFLLAGGLLLTIWKSRVSFREDGILISGPFKKSWKAYVDLAAVGRTADRVELRFADGSRTSINRYMADPAGVVAFLEAKVPGK